MYTTIFIYETYFQKSIIDHLIEKEEVNTANTLIVDATNHKLKIEGEVFNVNFNKIRMLYSSIKGVRALKKKNISCETLVSTHITGLNALFLSAFLKATKKILIDDGIGTPVLIQNQNIFKRKLKWQIRFLITKFLLFLNEIQIKSIRNTLSSIDQYFTVYKIKDDLELPFPVYSLNFYENKFKTKLERVCFIGSPLLDFNLCDKASYKELLLSIKEKYGEYKYYLHPNEQIALSFKIKGIEFIKLPNGIEKFFYENDVPGLVIGFTSSVLLNLSSSKYINVRPQFRYINMEVYGPRYDKYYYEALEENNILNSGLYI